MTNSATFQLININIMYLWSEACLQWNPKGLQCFVLSPIGELCVSINAVIGSLEVYVASSINQRCNLVHTNRVIPQQ